MVAPDKRFQGEVKSEAAARFVLGLAVGCTPDEIKKAFKRLALVFHPDKNSGEEADEAKRRFQMIARAKDLLLDKKNAAKPATKSPEPQAPKKEPPKNMRAEWRCSACDIQEFGDSPVFGAKKNGTCVRLGPGSACFCGHGLGNHTLEGFKCSIPGCLCGRFQYVPPNAVCTCGHTSKEHSAIPFHNCEQEGCFCQTFHYAGKCVCGHEWSCHNTVFIDASKQQTPRRPQSARSGTATSRSPTSARSPSSSSSEEPSPRGRPSRPSSAKPAARGPGSVPPPGFGRNVGESVFGAQFGIHISGASNGQRTNLYDGQPPIYRRPRPQSAHAGSVGRPKSHHPGGDETPKNSATASGGSNAASASKPVQPQSRSPSPMCQPCQKTDGTASAGGPPDVNAYRPIGSRPLSRAFGGPGSGAPPSMRTRPQSAQAAGRAKDGNPSADEDAKHPATPSGASTPVSIKKPPARPQSASVGGRWGARIVSGASGSAKPAGSEAAGSADQQEPRSPSAPPRCSRPQSTEGTACPGVPPGTNAFRINTKPLSRFVGRQGTPTSRSSSVDRNVPIRSTDPPPKPQAPSRGNQAMGSASAKERAAKNNERPSTSASAASSDGASTSASAASSASTSDAASASVASNLGASNQATGQTSKDKPASAKERAANYVSSLDERTGSGGFGTAASASTTYTASSVASSLGASLRAAAPAAGKDKPASAKERAANNDERTGSDEFGTGASTSTTYTPSAPASTTYTSVASTLGASLRAAAAASVSKAPVASTCTSSAAATSAKDFFIDRPSTASSGTATSTGSFGTNPTSTGPFGSTSDRSQVPVGKNSFQKERVGTARVFRSASHGLLDPQGTEIPKAGPAIPKADPRPRPRSASRAREVEEEIDAARAAEAGAFRPAQHPYSVKMADRGSASVPLKRPSAGRSGTSSTSPRPSHSPVRPDVVTETAQGVGARCSSNHSRSCTPPTPRKQARENSDAEKQQSVPARPRTPPRSVTPQRPGSPSLKTTWDTPNQSFPEMQSAEAATVKAAATAAASAATATAARVSAASIAANSGSKPPINKKRARSGSGKRPVSASKLKGSSRPPSASSTRPKADEDHPASGAGSKRPSRPDGIPQMPEQPSSSSTPTAAVDGDPWWERLYANKTATSAYRASSASRIRRAPSAGAHSRGTSSSKEESASASAPTQARKDSAPGKNSDVANEATPPASASAGTAAATPVPFPIPFPGPPPSDANTVSSQEPSQTRIDPAPVGPEMSRYTLQREDSFIYSDNEEGFFGVDSDDELPIPSGPSVVRQPVSSAGLRERPPSGTRRGTGTAPGPRDPLKEWTERDPPKDWAEEVLERLRREHREHLNRASWSKGPGT